MSARFDKDLYGSGGVSGLDPKAPLKTEEKHNTTRALSEVECHDCGQLIAKGEPMIVSSLECTQGTKGRTHRYEIHLACYEVVGEVVNVLGKQACHGFNGRPPLTKLWAEHSATVRKASKTLAKQLEGAFGKP
jgi:hypothetical protein